MVQQPQQPHIVQQPQRPHMVQQPQQPHMVQQPQLPDNIFDNLINLGSKAFYATFSGSHISNIPIDLFKFNTGATDNAFAWTFQNCHNISSIPDDLFKYNVNATTRAFEGTFQNISNITSIPIDLFRYNTQITSYAFKDTFYYCGITSIPTDIFRYNILVSDYAFSRTFENCPISSIPTGLFDYNTLAGAYAFRGTFASCTSLTSIPTDLFRYNTLVSNGAFTNTFEGSGLASVPADTFRYNVNVGSSGFNETFRNCTSLETVPSGLFKYNTSAVTYTYTFYLCSKLQLNKNIFFDDGEENTRFLNKSVDFTYCFNRGSFTGTQGEAPHLWSCSFGTGSPTKTSCFAGAGNSLTSISNYCDIPTDWGASGCPTTTTTYGPTTTTSGPTTTTTTYGPTTTTTTIGSLSFRILFDDIANADIMLGENSSELTNWNNFFNLPTSGTPFTSVAIVGNEVNLYGGSNIYIDNTSFYDHTTGSELLELDDQCGCIISCDVPEGSAGAFASNSYLTLINFPAMITAGNGCFQNNETLSELYLPELTSAGSSCFGRNVSCTSLDFPKLISIGDNAFSIAPFDTSILTELKLPVCINLGSSFGSDLVFDGRSGETIIITIPCALNDDGDIQYLQFSNSVTIVNSDGPCPTTTTTTYGPTTTTTHGPTTTTTYGPTTTTTIAPFIFEVNVGDESVGMTLPQAAGTCKYGTISFTYDFTIDWGDETSSHITSYNDAGLTHTYSTGTYQVLINGTCRYLSFSSTSIASKITKVIQWGTLNMLHLDMNQCTNLSVLPDGPITCVSDLEGFGFYQCTSLTSIPTGLFDYFSNVCSVNMIFYGCTSLTSIPSGLFDYLTSSSLTQCSNCFGGCTSLQTIPSGLFDNLTQVTYFGSCFAGCTSLQSIPIDLFDKNINATNFELTFRNCTSLTGNAPTLWLTYPDASSFWCFNNDTGLTNYADIPSNWK